ncbi:MAG: tetratricopeptide repeat protein [Desulfosarcina sp.]|nr:tetratricopeptide repeat protein [Desulfosarcina sp.]MBC2741938.1 tetratricopeptide repeat protein [Desulfosarcina sp.]MBC2764851.1 tetratricopeptide repeat protein [Desulfosarcina sp.]
MGEKKIPGYVKSENVIWFVVASLLIGFVAGVAFGIYKSGSIADPHQSAPPAVIDEERQQEIEALKAQTEQNPQDVASWIQLGHLYFGANRPNDAIEAYGKALAIEPENANVWTDLGIMYRRSGSPEKAVEAFDRAMKIDATHEISRFNKGIVLFHDLKDETGALAAWESLLAINPNAKSPGGQTVRELVDHIKENHQDRK